MEVKCTKCGVKYVFKKRWVSKHDPEKFICRKCNIISKTTSDEFRESQRKLSIHKLSDADIRKRMSLIAQINNLKSSTKISRSLIERFKDPAVIQQKSKSVKKLWADPNYRDKVSAAIKEKWKNPDFRRKIKEKNLDKQLSNMFKNLNKEERDIKKILDLKKINYEMNYRLHVHEFSFFIKDKYLIDIDASKEKSLFIKNYFPEYKIISSITVLMRFI